MKILKVEFENINSLKGFHEIDFSEEPFLTNSLFAITGPTGSGKSTILDVISLALFNHVPRLGKITRNEIQSKGAILTRNQKNSMARVTYQCNHGIYSSQWSIEVNRNGNLNDYEMELHDHHSGKLLDLKKSLVPGKNEYLIGLNYDQFIKAVLLAQGEFAQFLKAKKDERGELLEKITGTGIYRRLGIKAFEKNKEANREIQDQQNEIKVIQGDLLKNDIISSHESDLKQKAKLSEEHQTEIDKIKKALQLKLDISEQSRAIKDQKQAEEKATSDLTKFESEHGFPLKQHEKVQAEADDLRAWNQLRKDLSSANESKEKIKAASEKNLEQQKIVLQQTSELVNKPVLEEEISDSLYAFRDKVLELQETRKNKLNSFAAKRDQLKSELRDTAIDFNELEMDNSIALLNSELEASKNKIELLGSQLNINPEIDIDQFQRKTRSKIKVAREASKDFAIIEELKSEISKIEKELKKDEPLLKDLPSKIKEAKTENQSIQQQLQNAKLKKENQLLKASLEEHRRKLKDNEPCPLCGAKLHPYAHEHETKDDELDTRISGLEEKFQTSSKNLHQLEATYVNLEKRQSELKENLISFQQSYQNKRTDFSSRFHEFENIETKASLDKVADELEEKLDRLITFEKYVKRAKAIQNAIPLAKEINEIISAGKTLKKELDAIYSGKNIQNDVQQISNNWSRLEQEQVNIKEQASDNRKKIDAFTKSFNHVEKTLNEFILNTDLNTIENAWYALMPEADAARLRNEKQQISKRIDDSKASVKLLNEQLLKLKELDTEIEKDKLEQDLELKTEQFKSLNDQCKELERALKNQEDRLKRMKALKLEIEEKEKQTKRWRLLNELIGDSKGKGFNDFAQDLTLSQLLKHANKRLQDLNDRYLIDKPEPEEDDGLVAIDEHMGGQRRSVKTLSGGETFILSLSMALALSDLASKNVEINSLFIDEGFGTLDPETLDQTLDTLEKLQAESSKTIGIISHVDSLKERISTQIKLSRNGQGYSSLRIN